MTCSAVHETVAVGDNDDGDDDDGDDDDGDYDDGDDDDDDDDEVAAVAELGVSSTVAVLDGFEFSVDEEMEPLLVSADSADFSVRSFPAGHPSVQASTRQQPLKPVAQDWKKPPYGQLPTTPCLR